MKRKNNDDMTSMKTITVSLRINEDRLDYLKMLSHKLSLERNEDLNYNDLIREAMDKCFPMPKEEKEKCQKN